jgi:hypothetical protein
MPKQHASASPAPASSSLRTALKVGCSGAAEVGGHTQPEEVMAAGLDPKAAVDRSLLPPPGAVRLNLTCDELRNRLAEEVMLRLEQHALHYAAPPERPKAAASPKGDTCSLGSRRSATVPCIQDLAGRAAEQFGGRGRWSRSGCRAPCVLVGPPGQHRAVAKRLLAAFAVGAANLLGVKFARFAISRKPGEGAPKTFLSCKSAALPGTG